MNKKQYRKKSGKSSGIIFIPEKTSGMVWTYKE